MSLARLQHVLYVARCQGRRLKLYKSFLVIFSAGYDITSRVLVDL